MDTAQIEFTRADGRATLFLRFSASVFRRERKQYAGLEGEKEEQRGKRIVFREARSKTKKNQHVIKILKHDKTKVLDNDF